ncbi:porin, partial [Escherichia coli]|nr:porin [Escherichia coli]MDY9745347.1 porin [Escherichia coli]
NTDDLFVGKTLLHGDVLMWLMKTLLTSGCTNQRGAGQYVDADRVNYIEVGTWYYFNKNMNVYTAYKFNMLDKDDAAITGAAADDQFAVGIVYQF